MSLGYDVYEDKREFNKQGITGEVTRYSTAKMEFPCIVINSTSDNPVKMYSIEVLQKMFKTSAVFDEEVSRLRVSIYFSQDNKLLKLGVIQPNQVKSVLGLFESNEVDGFYDKDTHLTGDYLYVLAE